MIKQEMQSGIRLVTETPNFVSFEPFAARFPFETHILPKRHESHYESMEDGLMGELASLLRTTMRKIEKAVNNPGVRDALLTSLKAGLGATALAVVLGTLAAIAVSRYLFFGRETISFLVILPIALPGIVTGMALNATFRTWGFDLGLFTVIVGHATFCIVVVYNNAVARMRRIAGSLDREVEDLTVVILDRPRHKKLINDVRQAGARIKLIDDGDLPAAISVAVAGTNIHAVMGTGGAPEGVLAAAALRCLGAEILGRLKFRSDEEPPTTIFRVNTEAARAQIERVRRLRSMRL
jgi:hypothetical protein